VDQPALRLEDHPRGLLSARLPAQLRVSVELNREEPREEKNVEGEPDQRDPLEAAWVDRAHRVSPASTAATANPSPRSVRKAGRGRSRVRGSAGAAAYAA